MALVDKLKQPQSDWVSKAIDSHLDTTGRWKAYTPKNFWASHAVKCPRAIFYKMTGVRATPVPTWVMRLGHNGTAMHTRYNGYFSKMGLLVAAEKRFGCEDPPISGKVDMIVRQPGNLDTQWVVELKSYNSYAMKYLKRAKSDAFTQAQLAMHLLEGDIRQAFVLYEGRDSAEIKVFYIKYNLEYVKVILAKLRIIKMAVETGQIPDKPVNSKGAKLCKYCDYKGQCWG